ncbi:MAG: 16S rRNA (uracil(1498)-N(3))-methyltransferase [Pyrinomonadaceae bacterium]|nr:16S rRNA (uracil(1498)-N(3))-methyltransferase [Pyrinomonadaceae bacterium]
MRKTILRDVTLLNVTNRRRFFAAPAQFDSDKARVTLDREETHHLRKVLRLTTGDEVFVFDGEGDEFLCVVEESGREAEATLAVRQRVPPAQAESPLDLTLAVALLKNEKLDWVVQKATELGVRRITPVMTKRADVRVREEGETTRRRIVRLERLALQAAKQSGRARVPAVDAPIVFDDLLSTSFSASSAAWAEKHLMFAERGGRGLAEVFSELTAAPSRVTALVGPEGGWEDAEIEAARERGWMVITLGGRTLRAETAAITIVALLQHLCGDLV